MYPISAPATFAAALLGFIMELLGLLPFYLVSWPEHSGPGGEQRRHSSSEQWLAALAAMELLELRTKVVA